MASTSPGGLGGTHHQWPEEHVGFAHQKSHTAPRDGEVQRKMLDQGTTLSYRANASQALNIFVQKNTHRSFKFFFLGQFLYISAFDTFCIPVVSKKCTRRAQCLSGGPGSHFWLVETDQSQARLGGSWGGGVEGMSRVCPDLIPGSIICNHLTLRPTREVSGLCPVENALYRKWKTTQMCTLSHQSIWQLYES